ncbi:MAG: DHH family phosphoesterase, partial [Chloroflexota bacterium]|nr:DHH family phosphoesterase [Chloroflexota bacterium]
MPAPPPDSYLARMRDFTPLESALLFNRGISDPSQATSLILCADSLQDSPFLLPDMERALSRVHRALRSNERIAVYGDFDADGVCGTVVMVEGIRHLGGQVIPYIPHRLTEDRGLNIPALEYLLNQGVTLLITVDCGIGAVSEIEFVQKKGMDVIVTDHHQPPSLLPPALAVINPCRRDLHDPYPFHFLCGAGVAYKFMQALFDALGSNDYLRYLLDLVAIATIADMVSLTGENRYLVTKGLQALNETTRLGLREVIRLSGCAQGKVDEFGVGWLIGPRLNAPGRIDNAMSSYAVLTSTSSSEAARLALELERI